MRRMVLLSLCFLLTGALLAGCWSRRELNDLSIVGGIGIDKSGDQYKLSAQVVIPEAMVSKRGGSTGTPTAIFRATAPSMVEAIRKMVRSSPRYFYLSHLRVLVISEQVAREGIRDILDFFSRDNELRADFYILIAKGEQAEKILSIVTHTEKSLSNKLFKSMDWNKRVTGETANVYLDDLLSDLISPGKSAVLTGVEAIGSKQTGEKMSNALKSNDYTHFKFSSTGVFKDDKLVGWLNDTESRDYNYIIGKVKSTVESLACPKKGTLDLVVNRVNSKIKGVVKNGKPEAKVKLFMEVDVTEVKCVIDLNKPETLYGLEKDLKKKLTASLRHVINKAQKTFGSDIFGFGNAIHRSNPQAWKQLKKNWRQEFANLPVELSIDVKIRRTGTQTNSFINDMKKKEEQ